MKATKKLFFTAIAVAAITAAVWAEDPASPPAAANPAAAASPAPAAPAPPTITVADVQALKDALAAQQLQIDRLTKQLELQQPHRPSKRRKRRKRSTQRQPPAAIARSNWPKPAAPVAVQQDNHEWRPQPAGSGARKRRQSDAQPGHFHSLPWNHHHPWRIRRSCICAAIESAWSRPAHSV